MNIINKGLATAISCVACLAIVSCSNDEPMPNKINDETISESIEDSYMSNTNTVVWDTIVSNQLSKNEIFIGSRYLGIQNWNCIGNPADIYLGAVFPESTFGNNFDREVTGSKNPILAYTDFSDPFISTIENPSGANYNKFIKQIIRSDEYTTTKKPQLNLFRIANISNLDSLRNLFKYNKDFAKAIQEVVEQDKNFDDVNNWTIGEIIFKGFNVTMDIPETGIFINKDISEKGLVYVRSITYGATAYFVIGSDLPFSDIKGLLSNWSAFDGDENKLKNTSITIFTNSSLGQNATIHHSFESLHHFLNNPYDEDDYGYPVYCTGCYLEDNSFFH